MKLTSWGMTAVLALALPNAAWAWEQECKPQFDSYEQVTAAAKKGNADIAIGNIIGSNIFNILFVVGSSALITPVPFEPNFIIDSFVAILIGLVLYICTKKTRVLDKKAGILLLITYLFYFIYLL